MLRAKETHMDNNEQNAGPALNIPSDIHVPQGQAPRPAPPHAPRLAIWAVILTVAIIVFGGGYLAFSQGWINLSFQNSNHNSNVTNTTNTPAADQATPNTNQSEQQLTNTVNGSDVAAPTEQAIADYQLATCYVNLHPDVLQRMPQNDLTASFDDYVNADPKDLGCETFSSTSIESAKTLLTTDADHDGVTAISEEFFGTSDTKADSNGNGINDLEEILNPPNPTDNIDFTKDADGDKLVDDLENTQYHTNPNKADSDGDGLSDYEEVSGYLTDPLKADTDGDGYLDGDEVCHGYNPNGSGEYSSPLSYPPAACPTNLTPTGTSRPAPTNKTTMTIDNLKATVSAGTATVTWTTSEGSYAALYFGPTSAYTTGRYPDSLAYLTDHSVSFSVTSGQTYHYAVLSCPKNIFYLSECAVSGDQTIVGQ